MRKTYLGELEEIVLLVVATLYKTEAYGVAITQKIVEETGRDISVSAVHATLHRLEEKGFLKSITGGATAERGGRRKRFFMLNTAGQKALRDIRHLREQLWQQVPAKAMSSKLI